MSAPPSPLVPPTKLTHTPRSLVKETLDAHTTELDDGQSRINQYRIVSVLGRGAYGIVHLAVDEDTDMQYAMKEFSKSRLKRKSQADAVRAGAGSGRGGWGRGRGRGGRMGGPPPASPGMPFASSPASANTDPAGAANPNEIKPDSPLYLIRGELAIYKKLSHPNVLTLHEVLDDPEQDSMYMVFDLCEKGTLLEVSMEDESDPMDASDCRRYFRQLVLGIEYLHESGVLHRDLKPDNIMLDKDDTLKIVDFGVSSLFAEPGNDRIKTSAGSPAFMAPELISHRDSSMLSTQGVSGRACDVWSMGVVLYCMCFGRLPFRGASIIDVYDAIRDQELVVPADAHAELKHLLHRLLDKNPETRAEMSEIREHPWVTVHGRDSLPSTAENCQAAVTEVSEEEIRKAVKRVVGNLFTVMKAVSKFKRGRQRSVSNKAAGTEYTDEEPSLRAAVSSTVTATQDLASTVITVAQEQATSAFNKQIDRVLEVRDAAASGVQHIIAIASPKLGPVRLLEDSKAAQAQAQ